MKKYIIFISVLLTNLIFSDEISFSTVKDNSLEPHPDYTWEMFFRSKVF